jgi:lipopolysaccharide/colanic/teichoic acid biosynthesis glycosyltransferase
MALVGPRPEDPRYVDLSDPLHATVFGALPGITGITALRYRDEEQVLARIAQDAALARGSREVTRIDVETVYRKLLLPKKLESDAQYLQQRSWQVDLRILGGTLGLWKEVRISSRKV